MLAKHYINTDKKNGITLLFLMNLCMCMCRFRCRCRLRYSWMWKSRCRCIYLTLMALVPALIAELLLVSSLSSTCSNSRTCLTAPACCCPGPAAAQPAHPPAGRQWGGQSHGPGWGCAGWHCSHTSHWRGLNTDHCSSYLSLCCVAVLNYCKLFLNSFQFFKIKAHSFFLNTFFPIMFFQSDRVVKAMTAQLIVRGRL